MHSIIMSSPFLTESEKPSGIASFAIATSKKLKYIKISKLGATGSPILLKYPIILLQIAHFLFLALNSNVRAVHINSACEKNALLRDILLAALCRTLLWSTKVIIHLHGGKYSQFPPPRIIRLAIKSLRFLSTKVLFAGTLPNKHWLQSKKLVEFPNFTKVLNTKEYLNNNKKYLYVGRLAKEKKIDELIKVFRELLKFFPCVELHICGDGPLERTLKKLVLDIDVSRNVIFHGHVKGKKKQFIFGQCQYIVLNSLYEGLPISLLEGMASGCIPIATAVGSIPHLIGAPEDRRGIAASKMGIEVADLAKVQSWNNATIAEYRDNCLTFVRRQHSEELVLARLDKLYKSLKIL